MRGLLVRARGLSWLQKSLSLLRDIPKSVHIVLLPGLDGGENLSREFRECLDGQHTSEVIEYPSDQALGYDKLKRYACRRLAQLSAPTVIIGESFSGPIAVRIAVNPPPNVVGLILVATFVEPPLPSVLRFLVTPMAFWLPPPRAIIRRYLVGNDAPEALVRSVADAVRNVSAHVLSRRVHEVLTVDACSELRRIELPILYLEGFQDRIVVQRRALAQCRPDLDWRIIDSPHLVLQCRPREAADCVNELVMGLSTT